MNHEVDWGWWVQGRHLRLHKSKRRLSLRNASDSKCKNIFLFYQSLSRHNDHTVTGQWQSSQWQCSHRAAVTTLSLNVQRTFKTERAEKPEISKPLSTIFYCSFKTGIVPEQLYRFLLIQKANDNFNMFSKFPLYIYEKTKILQNGDFHFFLMKKAATTPHSDFDGLSYPRPG